mmetsp:Transcript_44117/g.60265  ORF Transcript_44117/g.60265 Transcript_44117/m.60265 type:complete len:98 (-) Transcript_44117:423-716(-)
MNPFVDCGIFIHLETSRRKCTPHPQEYHAMLDAYKAAASKDRAARNLAKTTLTENGHGKVAALLVTVPHDFDQMTTGDHFEGLIATLLPNTKLQPTN